MRALLAACAVALAGCTVTPLYRSAHTLDPGTNEVAGGLTAPRANYSEQSFYDGTRQTSRPAAQRSFSVIDAVASRGMLPGLEARGRLAFAETWLPFAEIGANWRFLQRGRWHLAVQPALGGRPETNAAAGLRQVAVPVVGTVDLGPRWSVTAGGHAGWRWTGRNPQDPQVNVWDDTALQGVTGSMIGAAAGADWHDDTLRIGAMFGWTRVPGRISAPALPAERDYSIDIVQVTVTAGYLWGKQAREMEKTDREMERLIRQ